MAYLQNVSMCRTSKDTTAINVELDIRKYVSKTMHTYHAKFFFDIPSDVYVINQNQCFRYIHVGIRPMYIHVYVQTYVAIHSLQREKFPTSM